jgi:diguanylate cyclase (GGDEF)-like protein
VLASILLAALWPALAAARAAPPTPVEPAPASGSAESAAPAPAGDGVAAGPGAQAPRQGPVSKRVLLLFPYQADLPHTMLATESIREVFTGATDLTIELYTEYMDLNRFQGAGYEQNLADLYALKYHDAGVDLVLLTSTTSLDFWLGRRDHILPDAPAVFYDIVEKDIAARRIPPGIFGISTAVRYEVAADWILKTLPEIKEIMLVYGTGEADRAFSAPVYNFKRNLPARLALTDWSRLSLPEIKQRAAELSGDKVIFYHLMFEDAAGSKYRPIDALRELAAVSAVPIISGYDHFIGTGTIGGFVYSVEANAKAAAALALRILRGQEPRVLKVADTHQRFIFDYASLERHGIPGSALPPQSIVKNRVVPLWQAYRSQIIAVIAGFASLLIVTAVLVALNRKLGCARRELLRLNAELEDYAHDLERRVHERTLHLEEANRKLQSLSQLDGLTGVYNRRHFDKRGQELWQEQAAGNRPLSVVLLDVDYFKAYNDAYGHQAGDQCLQLVASALKSQAEGAEGSDDVFARYGGEEFAVVARTDCLGAQRLAENLRVAVRALDIEHGHSRYRRVSVSVGVASVDGAATVSLVELIRRADQALYESKASGRNRVTVWAARSEVAMG